MSRPVLLSLATAGLVIGAALVVGLAISGRGSSVGDFAADVVSEVRSDSAAAPRADSTEAAAVFAADDSVLVRFAAAGDVGTGGSAAFATAREMDVLDEQRQFDALLLLGDNIYEDGDPALLRQAVLEPFGPILDSGTDLVSVLGNHDVRDGNGPGQVAALGMPGRWYSRLIGDVLIVALDSNVADSGRQVEWLEETLRAADAAWIIAIMHHPAYSAGWHGSERDVQENFVPLFERYGVDLALSGHDHDYQRSKPINGTTYVVTGAAAKLRDVGQDDFTEVSWSTHHFVDIAVFDDRIVVQAIDHDGRAIDSFQLTKPGAGAS